MIKKFLCVVPFDEITTGGSRSFGKSRPKCLGPVYRRFPGDLCMNSKSTQSICLDSGSFNSKRVREGEDDYKTSITCNFYKKYGIRVQKILRLTTRTWSISKMKFINTKIFLS